MAGVVELVDIDLTRRGYQVDEGEGRENRFCGGGLERRRTGTDRDIEGAVLRGGSDCVGYLQS